MSSPYKDLYPYDALKHMTNTELKAYIEKLTEKIVKSRRYVQILFDMLCKIVDGINPEDADNELYFEELAAFIPDTAKISTLSTVVKTYEESFGDR